jgi:hypothetical protein
VNLMRRNLNKGQQAMALAMLYPEPEKGGRGKKSRALNSTVSVGFSATRLNQAREVLRHRRDLAEQVVRGTLMLDEALQEVHQQQGITRSRETQREELIARSTDLADKVNDGQMKFDEAIAEYHRRLLETQRIRESVSQAFDGLAKFPGYVAGLRQAIEAGAENPLDDKIMKLIHNSVTLLDKVWQEAKSNAKAN